MEATGERCDWQGNMFEQIEILQISHECNEAIEGASGYPELTPWGLFSAAKVPDGNYSSELRELQIEYPSLENLKNSASCPNTDPTNLTLPSSS